MSEIENFFHFEKFFKVYKKFILTFVVTTSLVYMFIDINTHAYILLWALI